MSLQNKKNNKKEQFIDFGGEIPAEIPLTMKRSNSNTNSHACHACQAPLTRNKVLVLKKKKKKKYKDACSNVQIIIN